MNSDKIVKVLNQFSKLHKEESERVREIVESQRAINNSEKSEGKSSQVRVGLQDAEALSGFVEFVEKITE